MGELKALREQQETLVNRAKDLNRKLWLAGLGLVGKAEDEGRKQLDKYVAAGEKAVGSEGTVENRYLVAARGLVATVRSESEELVERLVDAGRQQKGEQPANEYVLAVIGAAVTLRDETQKLFDDLVASGEQRQQPVTAAAAPTKAKKAKAAA